MKKLIMFISLALILIKGGELLVGQKRAFEATASAEKSTNSHRHRSDPEYMGNLKESLFITAEEYWIASKSCPMLRFALTHLTLGPDVVDIFNPHLWPNLKSLDLRHCNLEKLPAWLEDMPQLERLSLASQQDVRWEEVKALPSSLQELDVSNCALNKVPDAVYTVPALLRLNLQGNKNIKMIERCLPESLQELDISRCGLELIPDWIDRLIHLEVLSLNKNKNIEILDCITWPPSLKKLYLANCDLPCPPAGIARLRELEELDLSGNIRISKAVAFDMPASLTKLIFHRSDLEEELKALQRKGSRDRQARAARTNYISRAALGLIDEPPSPPHLFLPPTSSLDH